MAPETDLRREASKRLQMVDYLPRIWEISSDRSPGHHVLQRLNSELLTINRQDIERRLGVEEEDNNPQSLGNDARVIVSFTHNDPGNPVNWSSVRFRYPHFIWPSDVLQEQKNLHSCRRDCGSDQQYIRLVLAKWGDYLPFAVL